MDNLINSDNSFSELLRIGQAARLLCVHPNTLRGWERQKKISSIRIGGHGDRRYRRTELLALLSSNDGGNSAASVMPNQTSRSGFTPLTPNQLFQLISQQCISLSQAAIITGYHEDYLGQRARLGELKAVKIGRNWVTHRSCLDDFCKSHSGAYPHRPKNIWGRKNAKSRKTAISK
jgi:hypothetical protein